MPDPDTARIERIENRMQRVEDRQEEALEKIYERLNAISIAISPNASNTARIERIEQRILAIEKWQSLVIGIGTLAVILLTVFGPSIRKALNLE